jgi:mercuric reductase
MGQQYDLIILGSGSTAFAAALRAREYGARVLMVEKSALGGTCINWGCIPSKTLIHAALFARDAEHADEVGIGTRRTGMDYDLLAAHKSGVVHYLRRTRYLEVMNGLPGLSLVKGTGRFLGPGTVAVGDAVFTADRILVATGGMPRVPKIPGLEDAPWMTSREALLLKKFPASMVVIGGGVISLELGQMFRRMGTRVTVLEHGPRLLSNVEPEPVAALRQVLEQEGIEIHLGTTVCSVGNGRGEAMVEAEVEGRRQTFVAEKILLAVGTAPATGEIGLELVGVAVDGRGYIRVDDRMRTSAPGVWAAGDVTGGVMMATVGAREGIVAVEDMFSPGCGCTLDIATIPMAIFTDPEVGLVGLTEEQARREGISVETRCIPVSAAAKAHVTGHTAGVVKIVAEAGAGRILGIHLCCHRGADIINEAALAVRHRLTVRDLATTVHVYPSMGESLRLCAQAFLTDITKLSCCAE